MTTWGECYYDHYTKFLREPVGRGVYAQGPHSPSIQILIYERVFPGCMTFCSLGLTHYAAQVKRVGEVLAAADDGWEDIPDLLANALFYMVQNEMHLGWGVAISGVGNLKPQFAARFKKAALYLTTPFLLPEEFETVSCGGRAGATYLAVFITQQEFDYFVEHGAEKLEERLAEKDVDPFVLNRPSCV